MICGYDFNIKTVVVCDVYKLNFDRDVRDNLSWTEIYISEILCISEVKPEIENIYQVYASIMLNCTPLIETHFAYKFYPLCYIAIVALEDIYVNALESKKVFKNVTTFFSEYQIQQYYVVNLINKIKKI